MISAVRFLFNFLGRSLITRREFIQTAAKSAAQGVTNNIPQTTQSAMLIIGEPTRRQFLRGFGALFTGSPVSVC